MSLTVAELVAKIEIQGDTEAKNKLQGVSDTVEKTQSGFKSMLQNALSFAAGGAITAGFGFLKDQLGGIFSESMDAQAGLAQTVQVLKSTHDASGMTAQGILDLATQYSHLTKFSDDTVQAGENMLLTFTNIGKDVFPQATKTVLDMSQALGQDTKSSAIQLGKALNDPINGITALQRVGVTFDDTQKNLIKTYMQHGEVAKAQGVILQELQKEFGGSAEAAGKTFGGQLVILNQYLDDLKQNIGDAIIPVLAKLLGAAMPLISAFVDFSGVAINDTIDALTNLSSRLESVAIPVFEFSRTLIAGAESHFTDLANTLKNPLHEALDNTQTILDKKVIPRFQDLQSLVAGKVHQAFIDYTPVVRQLAGTMQNDLAVSVGIAGNALQATGDWIVTTGIPEYTNFASVVKDKLASAFDSIKGGAQNIFGSISGTISSHLGGSIPGFNLKDLSKGLDIASIKQDLDEIASIPLNIQNVFSSIGNDFSNFGQGAKLAYDTTLKPIFDTLGEWGSRIIKGWQKDFPQIQQQLGQFWDNIHQTLLDLENRFVGFFQNNLNLGNLWHNNVQGINIQELGDRIIDAFTNFIPHLTGVMLDISAKVFNFAGGLVVGVDDKLSQINGVFLNMGANMRKGAELAWHWVHDEFVKGIHTVESDVTQWGQDVADGFQEAWIWIQNTVRSGIDSVIGSLNGFISSLDQFGVDFGPVHIHPNVPHIPYLASGGDVGAGWFVAGDPGSSELVYAPGGAHVYNHQQTQQMLGNGTSANNQPIYLQIEGHTFARLMMPYLTQQKRLALGVRA